MACTYIRSYSVYAVGEHQYLVVGIISGQKRAKVSCIACMWQVLIMYPVNLHLVVAVDTCLDKNKTVANTVLMY